MPVSVSSARQAGRGFGIRGASGASLSFIQAARSGKVSCGYRYRGGMELCVIFDLAYRIPDGSALRVGPVTIGTDPPFPAVAMPPIRLTSDAPHWVISHPQRTDFHTSTYYWVSVHASDADHALRQIYERIDPGATFALSYFAGFEVQSRYLCMYDLLTRQNVSSRYSPAYRQVAVHTPEPESVVHLVDTVLSDPTLQRAAHYLCQGRRLWLAASTMEDIADTLRDMAILHFAKTIEALAIDERVSLAQGKEAGVENEKERIVAKLHKTLAGPRGLERKMSAIETAHRDLSRASNRYLDLKMAVLSNNLGLGPAWLDRAKELTKVRNRNIAHAGALLSSGERHSLFQENAQGGPNVGTLAEVALVAFLLQHAGEDWAGTVPARGSSFANAPGAPVHLDWG